MSVESIEIEEVEEAEATQEVVAVKKKAPGPLQIALTNTIGRFCVNYLPFLVQECKFGNKHWTWSRFCTCAYGMLIDPNGENGWHGGVLDLKSGHEYQPCAHCFEELSPGHHQWALTHEEEILVECWRTYRDQVLDEIDDGAPYKYELTVKLNDAGETFLMGRNEGVQHLAGNRGLLSDTTKLTKKGSDKPN